MSKTTVHFLPAHKDLTEDQHLEAVARYREWLDKHGDYGRLYMMNQDRKVMKEYPDLQFETPITGVDIYDGQIAILFRLEFTL